MTRFRLAALIASLALTAACAQIEPATRNATSVTALDEIVVDGAAPIVAAPAYAVQQVRVSVPRSLKVSEANLYYPIADIVWRGDAMGDRYAQVSAIVTEAAGRATADMTEGRAVVVDIEMKRFHALTQKARYSVGGSYGVKFVLTLRDAVSGALVEEPRIVAQSFPASGGQKAIEEEAIGLTEKVVVTAGLEGLIRSELSLPTEPMAQEPRLSLAE